MIMVLTSKESKEGTQVRLSSAGCDKTWECGHELSSDGTRVPSQELHDKGEGRGQRGSGTKTGAGGGGGGVVPKRVGRQRGARR
mmetsp:Transcript_31493/g.62877  ORF Transcript_31493/g.62877 Transcript_31493/m.62877 type:complete len:84 (-) Transcript_31493:1172-1423(-)